MFVQRQSDENSESEEEFKDRVTMKRKSKGSYGNSEGATLELPLSVQSVIKKIEQSRILRAKEDILSQLIEIMTKVDLIMSRYSIDSPSKKGSLTENQKKKRRVFLEKIDVFVKNTDIRERILIKLLSWLEEWNFILSEVAEIDIEEFHHWIVEMEMHSEMLKAIDNSVNTLCQISTSLSEERKRHKKKILARGTLWKAWKERVVKRPATAHALRPNQMICDQFTLNAKVSEIQDMLQELINTSMLSKLENNAIKYISATVQNLSKALNTVNDELKLVSFQVTNVTVSEEKVSEKVSWQNVFQELSEENEMLYQKLRDAEEKCDYLLRIKSFLGRQLLLPTIPLRPLASGSPQVSIGKDADSGDIDSLISKELEKIIDESQNKEGKVTTVKKDTTMTYVAQDKMAPGSVKQQAEEKVDPDQKKQYPTVLPPGTSDTDLDKEPDTQTLDMKKYSKYFLDIIAKDQAAKSGASSMWERLKKGRSDLSLPRSPGSSEFKLQPPGTAVDKESKTEAGPATTSHPKTPQEHKTEGKGKSQPSRKTEEVSGSTKQRGALQPRTPKQTMVSAEGGGKPSPVESFHRAIMAFLREKINNVGKALDPESIQEEESSLGREEIEKLSIIKAKMEEYFLKVAETVVKTLKEYKVARKGPFREKVSKQQKAAPVSPQLPPRQASVSTKFDINFLLSELTDPVIRMLVQMLLEEIERERESVSLAAMGRDHKKKRRKHEREEQKKQEEEAGRQTEEDQSVRMREEVDKEKVTAVGRDEEDGQRPKESRSKPTKTEPKTKDMFRVFTQSTMVLKPRWMKTLKPQSNQAPVFQVDPDVTESPYDRQTSSSKTLLPSAKPLPKAAPEKSQLREQVLSGPPIYEYGTEKQIFPPTAEQKQKLGAQLTGTKILKQTLALRGSFGLEKPQTTQISQRTAEEMQISGVTPKPVLPLQQIQVKDITVASEEARDQGITPIPEPVKEPRITLTLQQAQALGITLTPEQVKTQKISLTLQQAQALGIKLTPEQTKEQRFGLTPQQVQALGITLTPEQAQTLGLTLTPEQAMAQRVSLTPQQDQVLGVSLTPQQAQAQRINLTSEQAQALGITLTPQVAKAQQITMTLKEAQALGIALTPQQVKIQGISLTPQQGQALGRTLTPEQTQAQGIILTPEQAQALGLILTPEQVRTQRVSLTLEQAQALGIALTPEQAQALGITLTPQFVQAQHISISQLAKTQQITMTLKEAQALGIALTPQQAKIQGISLTPQQGQTLGRTLTPEQTQAQGIILTPEQAQALGLILTPEQVRTQRVSLTLEQAQALGIALTPEQAQALGITLTPQFVQAQHISISQLAKGQQITMTLKEAQALGIALTPQQAKIQGISLTPQQGQTLGRSLTPEQTQAQGIILTPEQAQALGLILTPEQVRTQRVSLTLEQAQALGIALTPEQAQALGITLTPQFVQAQHISISQLAKTQQITMTLKEAQALGIALTPQQVKIQGISLTPQQGQTLGRTLTPEQTQAQGIILTPEQAQALGLILTPEQVRTQRVSLTLEQAQALGIALTPEQAQVLGITLTPQLVQAQHISISQLAKTQQITMTLKEAQALGIALTPQQAKIQGISLTPQQGQALGRTLTPEQTQAQGIILTPEQAQALGLILTSEQVRTQRVSLTLEQAQALGIALTPEQAQALGITLTPQVAKAQQITMTLKEAQTLGIALTPQQVKIQGISLTPQQGQILGRTLTPEQTQTQGIILTPEQAQALGLILTSEQVRTQRVSLSLEQAQALGIALTPEQAQALGITLTPQVAKSQQITMTLKEAQALGIALTPQQAKIQGISLTPQQGQALGRTLTPEQTQAQGIILTPEQAQALGLILTSEQVRTQKVSLTLEQAQALGIALTPEQAQALGITLTPQVAKAQQITMTLKEAQALGIALTPQQVKIQGISLTPQQGQALGRTLTPEQTQAQGIILTLEQAQALGLILTPEQVRTQRVSLTLEQAQVLGIALTPEQAQALGITFAPKQAQPEEISLSLEEAQALGLTLTPQQAQIQKICLTPQQAHALGILTLTPEQDKTLKVSLTPEQAQALGLTLTPEQAKAQSISLNLEQAEALGLTLTAEQARALGISVAPSRVTLPPMKVQDWDAPLSYEHPAALRGRPTTEQIQTLKIPVIPEASRTPPAIVASKQTQTIEIPQMTRQPQVLGFLLPQRQGRSLGISLMPGKTQAFEQTEAPQPPLIPGQASLVGQLGPGETQTLMFTITVKKAQDLGVTFTQEQTQAAAITLTSEQVAALEDVLTEELAWKWGVLITSEKVREASHITKQLQAWGIDVYHRVPLPVEKPTTSTSSPDRPVQPLKDFSPTSIPLSPFSQVPFSSRSLGVNILPESEEPHISPAYRQLLADRGQSPLPELPPTLRHFPTPGAPFTPGLPLHPWHFFKPGDSWPPLMPETHLAHRRPTSPLVSGVPPTSGEIPGLLVPGSSAVPREFLIPGSFQPPTIREQAPYMQTYSTPGHPRPSMIIPEDEFPLRITTIPEHPSTAKALPVPGRPHRISPSSVSQKRSGTVSTLKLESARTHPSAALDFGVSRAPFFMEKIQEETQVLQHSPDMKPLGMFHPYVASSKEKPTASLPSLTTPLSPTSQFLPSERGQRPRLPPIDKPCILTPVSGMMDSTLTAQHSEDRYFVDVEAQRKNLAILNKAAQSSGLPLQYHRIARNLIIELLHMNTVRMGYLCRKYIAYRLMQFARQNIVRRLKAIQNTGKAYETQKLHIMLDKIDQYQKKVMWFWTEKQKQLEQRRKQCLWSMTQFFSQLEKVFKLNLTQPVPLVSRFKHISDFTKFQPPVLELLIEDKKNFDSFKALGEEAQMEAVWNADLSTSSYPIMEKTSLNTLWAQLGGYPDIPRLLELDIQSTFRKSLASIQAQSKKIRK